MFTNRQLHLAALLTFVACGCGGNAEEVQNPLTADVEPERSSQPSTESVGGEADDQSVEEGNGERDASFPGTGTDSVGGDSSDDPTEESIANRVDRSPASDDGAEVGGPSPPAPVNVNETLKEVGKDFHTFYELYGKVPAAVAYESEDGDPLLSWRVALLTLDELNPTQFEAGRAWDDEANEGLLKSMPEVYRSPGVVDPTKTSLMLMKGSSTPFGGEGEPDFAVETLRLGPALTAITDGMSNTILAVYASPSKAVPWTKPEDLTFDPEHPLASVGPIPESGLVVLMWDGSVRTLPKDVAEATFRKLVEHADGEAVELP